MSLKWGLIALNGKTHSVERLISQMRLILNGDVFECVIAVDGGCKLLEDVFLSPTIILGDFDSVENLQTFKEKWPNSEIMTFPSEKDFTDAELAFEVMDKKKMDRVMVIGGFGGRVDHMISILHLLDHASNYLMIDEQNVIEKVSSPYKRIIKKSQHENNYVSLIPSCIRFAGVTLSGFKYPLNDAVIGFAQTLGISNEIVDEEGVIEIKEGKGYLIISSD